MKILGSALASATAALTAAGDYLAARAAGGGAGAAERAGTARDWEQIFDSITDFIFILDAEARIVKANRAALRRLDVTQEKLTGRKCCEAIHKADVFPPGCPYEQMLRDKKPHTAEMLETALGLPLLVTVSPILNGRGEISGAVHIAKDLSEKKEFEARLLQFSKMDALGRLAGGLAHEFNNILSIISSAFYMLRARLPADPETGEYSDSVQKAIAEASGITRHLLTLSQRQVLDLKPSDLSALAAETAVMLKKLLGEKTRVETRLAAGLPKAKTDPAQVNKLIMSLLSTETAAGRAVTLSTETAVLMNYPGAQEASYTPKQFVRLSVRDTAHSLEPGDLPHVFEPYYAEKNLGLAAAYGIARQHNGWIDVLEAGDSVSFEAYFPVCAGGETAQEPAPRRKAAAERNLKILVAEDDNDLRTLTAKALKKAGHQVWAADCAEKALEIYHELNGDLDALVSDVVMPGMSGVELADAILKVSPGVKVVLMSGYVDDRAHLESIQRRNYQFIYKPFDVDALLLKLRQPPA